MTALITVPPMDRVAQALTLREGRADDVLCLSALATQVFLETCATEGIRADLAREALAVEHGRLAHPSANDGA